jgi:hypothetical protein
VYFADDLVVRAEGSTGAQHGGGHNDVRRLTSRLDHKDTNAPLGDEVTTPFRNFLEAIDGIQTLDTAYPV